MADEERQKITIPGGQLTPANPQSPRKPSVPKLMLPEVNPKKDSEASNEASSTETHPLPSVSPGYESKLPLKLATNIADTPSSTSVRVFVTTDLTPHRYCTIVVKPGWQMADFYAEINSKLSVGAVITSPRGTRSNNINVNNNILSSNAIQNLSGNGTGSTGKSSNSVAVGNVIFEQNGADIGCLDDLRDDDHLIAKFQSRFNPSPRHMPISTSSNSLQPITPSSSSSSSSNSLSTAPPIAPPPPVPPNMLTQARNAWTTPLPNDGLFRVLTPHLRGVSPLAISEELIADMIQDEIRSSEPSSPTSQVHMRILLRKALLPCESTVQDTLLMTYDYFLSHHAFVTILIVHFRAPIVVLDINSIANAAVLLNRPTPPSSRIGASVVPTYGLPTSITDQVKRGAAQTRIMDLLNRWIELRFDSFKHDLACLEMLDDFITYLVASSERLSIYAEKLASTIKSARRKHASKKRNLDLVEQIHLPREKVGFSQVTETTPFELACQLTLADQKFFSKIKLIDLRTIHLLKEIPITVPASKLANWMNHNNTISTFIASSIILCSNEPQNSPKKRASVINHFICAIDELKSMQNYNGIMQICRGLTHPSIQRMDQTWELVPSHLKQALNSIVDMMSPPYRAYKTSIESAEPPAIPFIDYHTQELMQFESIRSSDSSNNNINNTNTTLQPLGIDQLEMVYKMFKSVLRLQSRQYDLIPQSGLYSFIIGSESLSMQTLMEFSERLEPPQNSQQDSPSPSIPAASLASGTGISGTLSASPSLGSSMSPAGMNSSTSIGNSSSIAGGSNSPSPSSSAAYSRATVTGGFKLNLDQASGSANSSSSGSLLSPNSPSGITSPASAKVFSKSSKDANESKKLKEAAQATKKLDKDEEKRKKKMEKQLKKVKPLLTPSLSLEQGMSNQDIFEQFCYSASSSSDPSFIHGICFYKQVLDFKKLTSDSSSQLSKKAREEASKIAFTYLSANAERSPSFSSNVDQIIKDVEAKAKSDHCVASVFDPLVSDLLNGLGTAFGTFKLQKTMP